MNIDRPPIGRPNRSGLSPKLLGTGEYNRLRRLRAKPQPGKNWIKMKDWREAEMKRHGIKASAVAMRLQRGRYAGKIKSIERFNARVVFIVPL